MPRWYPLFLNSRQTFIHGLAFKEEMKKLVAHYDALPEDVLRTGLSNFAGYPPEDASFLTTQMWDKYMPEWRETKAEPKPDPDPMANKELIAALEKLTNLPEAQSDHQCPIDELSYVKVERQIHPRKGKWQRFSDETEEQIRKRHDGGEPSSG